MSSRCCRTSIPGFRGYRYSDESPENILNSEEVAIYIRTTRLDIHSTSLTRTIRNVVQYYPGSLEATPLKLEAPYMLIAHYLEEFEGYLESHQQLNDTNSFAPTSGGRAVDEESSENSAVQHLEILLNFFKATMHELMVNEKVRHTQKLCTFQMLWLLYKPGVTVYFESSGQMQAYVVQSVDVEHHAKEPGVVSYSVNLWNLDYDGHFVGRCLRTASIPRFEGERKIPSLKVFPCEFIDEEDGGKTRQRITDNGRKWYHLLRGGQMHYSGSLADAGKKEVFPMALNITNI